MRRMWLIGSVVLLTGFGLAAGGCQPQEEGVASVPPGEAEEPFEPVAFDEEGYDDPEGYEAAPEEPAETDPEPQPESEPEPQAERTYTVRAGDTLWSIAEREYGDGQRWEDIASANPEVEGETVYEGQEIVLPD